MVGGVGGGGGRGSGFVGQDAVCRSSANGCYLFASERQRLCVCGISVFPLHVR